MTRLIAEGLIRDVPDFPKPGILFKDITPVLKNHEALQEVNTHLANWATAHNIDAIVGIEARGFIFGTALALEIGVGFVPVRKLGKLPYHRLTEEYSLEYGTNTIEIHADALHKGERVIVIDDLLATGGTASATARLVERLGAEVVGIGFVVELDFLQGREVLSQYNVHSLIKYGLG